VATDFVFFIDAMVFGVVVQLEEEGEPRAGNPLIIGIPAEICVAAEGFAE
jgi:hypothetical protein